MTEPKVTASFQTIQRLPTQVTAEMGIAFTQSGDSNVGCRLEINRAKIHNQSNAGCKLEINRTKIHNQSLPIRPEPVLAISHDAPKPLVNLDLPTKGKSTDNPAETLVLNRRVPK